MKDCMEIVGQVEDGNGTQRFVGQRDEGMPETSTVLVYRSYEMCSPAV